MASRIFWILLSGAALVTGIALQDGGHILSWGDESERHASIDERVDRAIDKSVDKSVDKMDVVTADGREIHVSPEQEHALTQAIGRLVKAESDLVVVKVRRGSDAEVETATIERDKARAEIEQLKAEINREQALRSDSEAKRREIERQVRDDVRESIRDAVRG